MKKKKFKLGLSAQINIVFTTITLITSILFIIIFKHTIKNFTGSQADGHLRSYHESVIDVLGATPKFPKTSYYLSTLYGTDEEDNYYLIASNKAFSMEDDVLDGMITKFINTDLHKDKDLLGESTKDIIIIDEKIWYIIERLEHNELSVPDDYEEYFLLSISIGLYYASYNEPISNVLSLGFIAIIILGNAIILLWTSLMVERIKKLQSDVSILNSSHYEHVISVKGSDEISQLAEEINMMQVEIQNNDTVKTEMLQNISHDIKTPIAVIRSYAEAIQDGVSDISEVNVIIKQSEVLARKVKQLLDWNKLEYIKDTKDYQEVNMKDLITNVANSHKYRADIQIILDLDNTYYYGLVENYNSMINNIVENALRYANKEIRITLKDKKITIFNDGEPISDAFLTGKFKPYEKGHKGQFGLGMIIVQRTVESFNLKLSISNLPNGVEFVIEPRE